MPSDKLYAQLHIPLDHLLSSKPFYKDAMHYLIACQVESKSKATIAVYAIVLNAFLRFNSKMKPDKNDIREFLFHIQSRGGTIHTHMYYRTLKTFFSWLVREGLIKHSPMDGMKAPRLPKLVITPLNNYDIKNLLVVTSGNRFVDFRNRAP